MGDWMEETTVWRGRRHPRLAAFASGLVFRIGRQRELRRVRTHLIGAEAEVARRPVELSPALRAERERNLARLHAYWVAGRFPKNTDVPRRVPHLRDRYGTPCAVAYLVESSGRRDFIDALAAENNHVVLRDVSAGPLAVWLDAAGLTPADAARIQPAYDWPGPPPPPPPPPDESMFPFPPMSPDPIGGTAVGVPVAGNPLIPSFSLPDVPYTPHLPPPSTPAALPQIPDMTMVMPDNGLVLAYYVVLLGIVLLWAYLVAHGAFDWRYLRARISFGVRSLRIRAAVRLGVSS